MAGEMAAKMADQLGMRTADWMAERWAVHWVGAKVEQRVVCSAAERAVRWVVQMDKPKADERAARKVGVKAVPMAAAKADWWADSRAVRTVVATDLVLLRRDSPSQRR